MLSLRVLAHPDDTLIANWGCDVSSTPQCGLTDTTNIPIASFKFQFRALLTDATPEVRLERVTRQETDTSW
jgi:hypothetical protein